MDISRARYFLVVAKHQSMTRASEELHVAEPAVSQAMKRLTEEVGFPLFERKGRNIRLTKQGEMFYDMVKPILGELDKIPGIIQSNKPKDGESIRVSIKGNDKIVGDLIDQYCDLHPEVNVELVRNEETEPWDIQISTQFVARKNPSTCNSGMKEEFYSYMNRMTEQLNLT